MNGFKNRPHQSPRGHLSTTGFRIIQREKNQANLQFFLWGYSQDCQERCQENVNNVCSKTWEETGHFCPYFASEFKSLVKEKAIFLTSLSFSKNALHIEKKQSILTERNPVYLNLSMSWLELKEGVSLCLKEQ